MSADYAASEPVTMRFSTSGRGHDLNDCRERALEQWTEFSGEQMFPWDSELNISQDRDGMGGPNYVWDLLVTTSASTPPAPTT